MHEPDVAIVFTPETWVEELHRFFVDHGGARVRQLVVDPAIARTEHYSILIVSWRWPSLTRGLVAELHDQGRRVLGVSDRATPESAELLNECRVDRVVTSDAPHHEFLEALVLLESDPFGERQLDGEGIRLHASRGARSSRPADGSGTRFETSPLVAVGGPGGPGTTEVAIQFAYAGNAVLVDGNEIAAAIAPRLGLSMEPNIRSAIDAVEFGMGDLDDATQLHASSGLRVVTGIPHAEAWAQVRPGELMRALRALCGQQPVVVDLCGMLEDVGSPTRGRFGATRAVLLEADTIVGVGSGTPLGVIRLLGWVGEVHALRPDAPIHIVMNRSPSDRFRKSELGDEFSRAYQAHSLCLLPEDRRVGAAGWTGDVVRRGPFTKAMMGVVDIVLASIDPVDDTAERQRAVDESDQAMWEQRAAGGSGVSGAVAAKRVAL